MPFDDFARKSLEEFTQSYRSAYVLFCQRWA